MLRHLSLDAERARQCLAPTSMPACVVGVGDVRTARARSVLSLCLTVGLGAFTLPAAAQAPPDLERLVDRVALYPDPLLSDVLVAASYPDQIPEAARWANEHAYLRGDMLARAMMDDRLWFDPSVQALLPFPGALDMMARDMDWTQRLGDAFLYDRGAVMDAVQRLRRRAWEFGYLRGTPDIAVRTGAYIEIV